MKRIKWIYGVLFTALTVLWLFAEQPWAQGYDNFFQLRHIVIHYTGFLAIGAMSATMMLAIRPARLEPWLGGLDKTYRLHKWLGVTAAAVGAVHWLWAAVVRWVVEWGWLKHPQSASGLELEPSIQEFFQEFRPIAVLVVEWTFYAVVVLVVLAVIKRLPYRYFFKTHRFIAVAYLVFVFHSIFLIKFSFWTSFSPIAMFSLLLMVGGTVAAILSLTRRIGHHRRALGKVEALEYLGDGSLRVNIRLPRDHWDGHNAGQFAFVRFYDGNDKEAHPFTISSAWKNDGELRFYVKNLGDYTGHLPRTLKEGDRAAVEGPYGCFKFESDSPRQIWVAGGIGITPFLARLEELAHRGSRNNAIDLFFCVRNPDEAFVKNLEQLAGETGVKLWVVVDGRDPLLNADRICAEVPEWRNASVWFCGPARFGHVLREGLRACGFDTRHFHRELFEMR